MQLKLLAASLIATLGVVSTAHAQSADAAPGDTAQQRNISGTYATTFGSMTLHQNGNHVIGNYVFSNGQIDGTFDGTTLRFSWREDDGSGFGVFVVAADGSLAGTWGVNDDHSSGAWIATLGTGSVTDGLAASPFGDSTLKAGSLSWELYMPWDGTFAAGNAWVGMAGLGIGVGKRITPDWYLGVTADAEYLMGVSGSWDGPDVPDRTRLRGGVEARYIFGHGSGVGTVNCGPEFAVDRYSWVGARAGVETLDEGTTYGGYGELSLGTAFALGQAEIGMYVAGGLTVEPESAYGLTSATTTGTANIAADATTPSDGSPQALGAYIAMGMIFTLG